MKERNRLRLVLGILAFVHINFIAISIVFSPFGFLNDIILFGNFFFLGLNGLLMGGTFVK